MIGGRRGLALLAAVALVAALLYWSRTPPQPQVQIEAQSAKPAAPAVPAARPTSVTPPQAPGAAARRGPQAPDLPFAFLGRLTEGGESVILLHGGGRVLRVRGVGPLTNDYEVTAIYDNHIVLRYLPLGTEQKLELASRANAITFDSPADSPQD